MSRRQTLLIDFDGTIATYKGWLGPDVLGEPLESARKALFVLEREYRLVCFTTRERSGVERWLRTRGFPSMKVTNLKEPAFLIIDDRALTFEGQWSQDFIDRIKAFVPHWQRGDSEAHSEAPTSPPSSPPAS